MADARSAAQVQAARHVAARERALADRMVLERLQRENTTPIAFAMLSAWVAPRLPGA